MINLLHYNEFLNEYYNSFNSRVKDWNKIRLLTHNIATKKGYFDNIFKKMTPEDKDIIEWYRDGGYRQIANFLFNNNLIDKAEFPDNSIKYLRNCILKLDNILEKTKIKKNVVLWKGLISNPYIDKPSLIDVIKKLNINDTYIFQNFFSTSINFQYALFSFTMQNDYDKILIKINTPAGTKGAYISHDKVENEVLLQRNQTIKLKKIYEYDITKLVKRYISHPIIKIYEFDLI